MTTKAARSFTLLSLVFAVSLQAATIDVTRFAVDSVIGDVRETNAPLTGYYEATSSQPTLVGGTGSSSSSNRYVQNLIYRYTLPSIGAGKVISSFTFDFHVGDVRDSANADPYLDVYLLNLADPTTTGGDLFYDGSADPNHDKIGDYYFASTNTQVTANQDVSFTINSGNALTTLNGFYDANGDPTQTWASFRFNLDKAIPVTSPYSRYYVDNDVNTSSIM
ncbi:MAG: hypothetical protein RRC34_05620 [Lentisphaeria bacterium]|nr:hypothetical protein [Lentisphaeria bacterium]